MATSFSGSKGGSITPTPPPQPRFSILLQILILIGLAFLIYSNIKENREIDNLSEGRIL